MARMVLEKDEELRRTILVRLEDVMEAGRFPAPSDFRFDGYRQDQVGYNVEALYNEGLIDARVPAERTGRYQHYPIAFTVKGKKYLDGLREAV